MLGCRSQKPAPSPALSLTVTQVCLFLFFPTVLGTQMEVGAWTYHYGNKSDYSWELARNFCRLFYTDLVAIQNQGEIVYLNNVLPRHRTYYWIGIRKINNVWTWVGTNKALTKEAENWANREPNNKGKNQDCVEIYIKRDHDAGRWNDENCQKKKRALCYQASCQRSSCSQRGECVETIGNYSCDCYPGFYGPECEHVVRCKNLDPRPDCSHPLGEFSYNSTCKFQCQEGFELQGLDTLQCLASGNWTAAAPECAVQTIHCRTGLGKPILMNCSHPLESFSYGSVCRFRCTQGYFLNGTSRVQCQPDGHWSDKMPACQGKLFCHVLASMWSSAFPLQALCRRETRG
uniref:L-selectin n=1 Tax=Terrapene triunguis TaxID=2587831 RepID=A0A674K854_9SAUR